MPAIYLGYNIYNMSNTSSNYFEGKPKTPYEVQRRSDVLNTAWDILSKVLPAPDTAPTPQEAAPQASNITEHRPSAQESSASTPYNLTILDAERIGRDASNAAVAGNTVEGLVKNDR